MFAIAILIGIYSYLIFSLGVSGFLYKTNIFFTTVFFIFTALLFYRRKILKISFNLKNLPIFFLLILVSQGFVNLIGALGPELGFDALWYHLTLPRIFLENHKIFHIPGGLLYYSDMSKFSEMIYTSAISLFSEIAAKLVHFSFGILVLIAIYKLSRKFMDKKFSILSCIIFYSNLVVGWQSTTAYIDLARTFFEVMALWGLMNYVEEAKSSAKKGWFIESAVMLGLAVSTKLLSLGTLFIFFFLILYLNGFKKGSIRNAIFYILISLYVVFPWFLFSFFNTGNPVYPLFTNYVVPGVQGSNLNPVIILQTFWTFFLKSSDPISPIYIIFLPFIFLFFKNLNKQMKAILLYFFSSLVIWYFFPAKDSRYMLPALAGLSIVVSYLVQNFKDKALKNSAVILIIFVAIISVVYRGAANLKYLPVILGYETKDHFLTNHLNFRFGDFYDTDGFFKNHVKISDRVLLYGFHNLYYIDFPFIDSSYVKKGDKFNYIAVQNSNIPERFKFWKEIYSNPRTGVKLYSLGGQEWIY